MQKICSSVYWVNYPIIFFIIVSTLTPFIIGSPSDYVGVPLQPPSLDFWFGTNGQGQDVFAQTIHGAKKTLFIAVLSGYLVIMVGAIVGGVILGVIETISLGTLSFHFEWVKEINDIIAWFVLIAVLMVKPNGLFGVDKVKKV